MKIREFLEKLGFKKIQIPWVGRDDIVEINEERFQVLDNDICGKNLDERAIDLVKLNEKKMAANYRLVYSENAPSKIKFFVWSKAKDKWIKSKIKTIKKLN